MRVCGVCNSRVECGDVDATQHAAVSLYEQLNSGEVVDEKGAVELVSVVVDRVDVVEQRRFVCVI